jgi:integrase
LAQDHLASGINTNLRHLSSAFSLGVKLGYLSENVFRKIKPIPEAKKYPVFLTKDQGNKLLDSTRGQHIHQYIMIALFTGCRVSEICNLKWSNVNIEEGYIRVIGKGNKERQIPLPNKLINYLREKPRIGTYVISGSRSNIYVAEEFRKAIANLDLKEFRFHDLRHTYASWLAQAGESIQVIKELLGHSSIQTTMIYAHLSQKTLINAVRSLDL